MLTVTAMAMVMAAKRMSRIAIRRLFVIGTTLGWVTFPVVAGEWTITPSIAISETASDNVFLSTSEAKSALVSDITPGISVNGSGGRSNLHLEYQMHNLFYSTDPSEHNQVQNALNASGTLEALENWLFIDATGAILQQSISAFGAAPAASNVSTNVNSNIAETSTYSLSPYLRGSFGSFADYGVRYTLSSTSSKAGSAYASDTENWLVSLNGKTRLASLGWSLEGTAMTIDQGNLRSTDDRRVRALLLYQITPQLQVSLIGGREENNYESREMTGFTNYGAGFFWLPTERTKISFSREERFFGPSNTLDFSHRTAHTAWTMSAGEDVTAQPNQLQTLSLGTNFSLLSSIYSTAIPDPVARAAFVNALLKASGISPDTQLQAGFLTNQTVLQQRRLISFAVLGARNTVTFSATQNNTQVISALTGDGFDVGNSSSQNNVDQLGVSINWSHQLTPLSSLIGSFSRMNSKGTGANALETTLHLASLNFVTQLGPKTNFGLGVRRAVSDGSTDYSESAVIATLSHQF
jgi:uncharacterized protein (PEP-CTERM system associated)